MKVFLLCWTSLLCFFKGTDMNMLAVPFIEGLRLNKRVT